MPTLLGVRRALLNHFPAFREVVPSRANGTTVMFALLAPNAPAVPEDVIHEWRRSWVAAGTSLRIVQSATLPESVDAQAEWRLLRRSTVPLRDVEDASVTPGGVEAFLAARWPRLVDRISDSPGLVVVEVSADATDDQFDSIAAASTLVCVVPVAVKRSPRPPSSTGKPPGSPFSATVAAAIERDAAHLSDLLDPVLAGETDRWTVAPERAPGGWVDLSADVSLFHALALFETTYFAVPLRAEDFHSCLGSPLDDVIAACETSRLVPVFTFPIHRYEATVVTRILEATRSAILPGELRLRHTSAALDEFGILRSLVGGDESLRELRRQLAAAKDKESQAFGSVLDALAHTAHTLRRLVREAPSLDSCWFEWATFLDHLLARILKTEVRRDIELAAVVTSRFTALGLNAAPAVSAGTWFASHSVLVNGLGGEEPTPQAVQSMLIDKLLLPNPSLGLGEFARCFTGRDILRLRRLLESPRLWGSEDALVTIDRFHEESRRFNGQRGVETAATIVGVGSRIAGGMIGMVIRQGWKVAKLAVEESSPEAADQIDGLLALTPSEGVALAKIRKRIA